MPAHRRVCQLLRVMGSRMITAVQGAGYLETYRGLVMPEETDAFGHMGTTHYMVKFTVALGQLYGRCGFSIPDMIKDGAVLVAVEQTIRYHRELKALDMVTVESGFLHVGEKSTRLRHRLLRGDGTLCATSEQVSVFFSLQQRHSMAIPPALRALMEAHFIKDEA